MIKRILLLNLLLALPGAAQPRTADVRVDFGAKTGELDTGRMALGQGGLSADPMWTSRVAEVRAL